VSAFLTDNASMLKLCLEEEASQAKGYIDVLQAQIAETSTPSEVAVPSRMEIVGLLGMQGELVSALWLFRSVRTESSWQSVHSIVEYVKNCSSYFSVAHLQVILYGIIVLILTENATENVSE
jgi:hypothetical protein